MSVLLREERGGRVLEVRAAGRTRRLYVDGVYHTSWNPGRALTGAVWDPLALATFCVRPEGARSALVLGVGGGAALRMLHAFAPPARLVGVEWDAQVLAAARRWFGLDETGAELVVGDARAWVRRNARRRFELVVDDLYAEEGGEPVRPPGLDDDAWWRRVVALVAPGGALVVNFVAQRDLTGSPLCQDVRLRTRFPVALRCTCPGYENVVAVFASRPVTPAELRRRILAQPALARAADRRLLRFRIGSLWPR